MLLLSISRWCRISPQRTGDDVTGDDVRVWLSVTQSVNITLMPITPFWDSCGDAEIKRQSISSWTFNINITFNTNAELQSIISVRTVIYLVPKWNDILTVVILIFSKHLFYLSSQVALTGFIFALYCHWPKYRFSVTLITCNLLRLGKLVVNPVHFLLTKNIGNQGIIV